MKVLYPDIVYGAIASSGTACDFFAAWVAFSCAIMLYTAVTHAAITNWEYMDVIRRAADRKCSANLVHTIALIDTLLKVPPLRKPLRSLFGLADLEHDIDFVSLLTVRLSSTFVSGCDQLGCFRPHLAI